MSAIRKYLFFAVFLVTGCTQKQNDPGDGVLVSGNWLQKHLNDTSLVILHIGTWEVFDSVHIPGSRYIDPYDFTLNANDLRNELPEGSSIITLLKSVGVNMDSRILLCYEDEDMIARAARIFMTLDYVGLGDRTFVLNGGLTGWLEEEGEVVLMAGMDGLKEEAEGDLEFEATRKIIMTAHELDKHRWDPDFVIVDSRSREEYYGELDSTGLIPTGGHIEGAFMMNYKYMLSESSPNLFRDDAELVKEFEKAGMDRNKTSVYYCGSGMRGSVNYLVAKHLGYPALLYDGSYEEWIKLELPLTSPVINLSETDLNKDNEN